MIADTGFDDSLQDLIDRVDKAEAECIELKKQLAESQANDLAAIRWLADARIASGDDGLRMLPDFIQYLKSLKSEIDEYRKNDPQNKSR